VLVAVAPAVVRAVLVEQARAFVKQNVVFASGAPPPPAGTFLRSGDWDAHLAARRLLHAGFGRASVAARERDLEAVVAAAVARWPAGEAFAVDDSLGECAVRALDEVVLHAGISDPGGLAADVHELMRDFRLATSLPRELLDLVRGRGGRALHARLRERCRELLAHAEPDGATAAIRETLPESQAADEVLALVAAGSDTVSAAAASALRLLATSPEEQDPLRADVLAGSQRRARAVLTETLRLQPPSWYIGRRAAIDAELGGRAVAAGTVVLVPVARLQRDPDAYPRPDEFLPARWLEAEPPAGAFLPFGLGLRRCLGEALAWAEGTQLLCAVAARGRVGLAAGGEGRPVAGATLRPEGVRVRLEEITRAGVDSGQNAARLRPT